MENTKMLKQKLINRVANQIKNDIVTYSESDYKILVQLIEKKLQLMYQKIQDYNLDIYEEKEEKE